MIFPFGFSELCGRDVCKLTTISDNAISILNEENDVVGSEVVFSFDYLKHEDEFVFNLHQISR